MATFKGVCLVPSDLPKQFDAYPFIAMQKFTGKLKGQILVVLGASTGIGKAIALAFAAAAGASLALVARRKTLLGELVTEIEHRYQAPATAIQADILNVDTPQNIISETESHRGGPFDILVNNAAHRFSELPKEAMMENDVMEMFERYQGVEWQKPELAANTINTPCSEQRSKILNGSHMDSEPDWEKVLEAAESGRVERERLYWLEVDEV